MGWASRYIQKLTLGEEVEFRPHGNSMTPLIYSGDLVTVHPIADYDGIRIGDVVLCKVHGSEFLHKVNAIRGNPPQFQISNNRGHVNGWCPAKSVYGKVVRIHHGEIAPRTR